MTDLEIMQRAKCYMDKLAQGIDPISERELPEDSALNNVRLARCFFYVSDVLSQVIANGGQIGPKPKRIDFKITTEQLSKVNLPNRAVRISEFVELLYEAVDNAGMRKLSTTTVTNWLLAKGFLQKEEGLDGKMRRVPTEAGFAIGLSTETRQGQYGAYTAVFYNTDAQKFLLDNLDAIMIEK